MLFLCIVAIVAFLLWLITALVTPPAPWGKLNLIALAVLLLALTLMACDIQVHASSK